MSTYLKKRTTVLAVILVAILALTCGALCGCASKYHALYGIADWQQKNALSLQTRWNNADDEERAFLEEYLNPYMNMLKYSVIAVSAIDVEDDVKLSEQIEKILKVAAKVEYNPQGLIQALRAKDYDRLEIELIVLKNLILDKLKIFR